MSKSVFAACFVAAALLAACGGGGSSGGGGYVTPPTVTVTATPTAAPTATPPASSQQVITAALPSTAIGALTDPTYGLIGGYTQSAYSQTLGFAPGSQVMIRNGQASVPHTFNVVSTTSFPASPNISTTSSGSTTINASFASGTVAGGALAGPFTLAAGTYYIGCAYHYASNAMRTVLNVAANATPGPSATPAPGSTSTPPGQGGGYY
jgi:hypothetical protein